MLKIQWDTVTDKFEHNFVIGNVESIWSLYFLLLNIDKNKTGGSFPINIKVYDLSGNEIDMKKGISESYAYAEKTHRSPY